MRHLSARRTRYDLRILCLKPLLPAGQGCVNALAESLLHNMHRTAGGVEFGGEPEIIRAPQAETVHCLECAAARVGGIFEVGEHAFDGTGEPVPGEPAHFFNCYGQLVKCVVRLPIGYPGVTIVMLLAKMSTHCQAPQASGRGASQF
jgi:hypothetical protein